MQSDKDTVSSYFVNAALMRLDAAAARRVLAAAGIAPELAAAGGARVPAAAFAALWLAVSRELDDEFFGLDSRRMKVGSFALLSHAALPCGNLDRALKQILRGLAVFLDDIDGTLELDGAEALLTLSNRIDGATRRRFAEETWLVMVHGLMCWLAGRRIALTRAEFAYPAPPHAAEYRVMYAQQLGFDAPCSCVRFDARALAAPVVQTPATLKEFLRSAPQSVFLKYQNADSVSARLRRRLRGSLGRDAWPRFDAVAAELKLAPTTLRRRLEAEGTSYQGLKDALRRDAAIHHLCHSTLPIAEIAHRLGYEEPSAFHRAFKKWCGVQPGEYRARPGAPTSPASGTSPRR